MGKICKEVEKIGYKYRYENILKVLKVGPDKRIQSA